MSYETKILFFSSSSNLASRRYGKKSRLFTHGKTERKRSRRKEKRRVVSQIIYDPFFRARYLDEGRAVLRLMSSVSTV